MSNKRRVKEKIDSEGEGQDGVLLVNDWTPCLSVLFESAAVVQIKSDLMQIRRKRSGKIRV